MSVDEGLQLVVQHELTALRGLVRSHRTAHSREPTERELTAIVDSARLLRAAGIDELALPERHRLALLAAVGSVHPSDRPKVVAALAWLASRSS